MKPGVALNCTQNVSLATLLVQWYSACQHYIQQYVNKFRQKDPVIKGTYDAAAML